MPTHKKGQDRDKYYQLAKDQGFRSRAAFKLIQINKRYSFLSKAKVCIDLCAAPGGWCQVAAKTMAPGSLVLGVDLLPIRPIRGVKTFVGDITTAKCRQDIIAELQGWKADVVLCDGAPNIGSAYSKDAFVQNELVLAALKTASDHLIKGGVFCTKIYRSVDYNALIWVLQQLFEDVQTMKPSSSRSQSSEIFLVCIGFIAPKSIDAKLFDPNHVFKEVADPGLQRPDVLHKKYDESYKRQRTGYDESLGLLLRATASVSDFIMSKDPVRMLTDVHEMKFSTEDCQKYLEHPRTIEEVKLALSDLKVLGKIDFKKLLKWRLLMRESYHATTKPVKEDKEDEEEDDGLDPEERILRDIDDMRVKIAQEDRKVEKKTRKELRKERVRQQLGMHHNAFDVGSDQELFALDPSLTSVDMARLADVDLDDENHQDLFENDENDSENEAEDGDNQQQLIEILDHDLEDELEADYQRLLKIKRSKKQLTLGAEALEEREFRADRTLSNKAHAKKQTVEAKLRRVQEGDEELLEELEEEYSEDDSDSGDDSDAVDEDGSEGEEEDEEEAEKPHFMVSKSSATNAQGKASKWFANPLFSATATSATADVSSVLQQLSNKTSKTNKKSADTSSSSVGDEDASNTESNKNSKKRKAAALTEEQIDAQFDYMPKTDKAIRKEKRKKATERQERKRMRQLKASAAEEEEEEDEHRIISKKNDEGFSVVPRDILNDHELTLLDQENSALVLKKKGTKGAVSKAEADANDFEVVSAGYKMPKQRPRGEDSEDDNDDDSDDDSSYDDNGFPRRHDTRMYDSDHEDYDRHDRLMTKAIGTMLVSNPAREKALYDSSYNRFAFNDPEGLPSWFMDDEMRHAKPSIPVPQALLDQIKNKYQMTGNNGAKVIKKVAEARMRKKKRAMLQLKKAKKQASLLAENNELSERQKVKLLAKAMRGKGTENNAEKKVYVTTRKTGAGSMAALNKGAKGKLKFVDKRLKKDKRAMKRVEKSKKKGRR